MSAMALEKETTTVVLPVEPALTTVGRSALAPAGGAVVVVLGAVVVVEEVDVEEVEVGGTTVVDDVDVGVGIVGVGIVGIGVEVDVEVLTTMEVDVEEVDVLDVVDDEIVDVVVVAGPAEPWNPALAASGLTNSPASLFTRPTVRL